MKLAYKIALLAGTAIVLLLTSSPSHGDQSQTFGEIVVHYGALAADQLPAEAARAYGFERSAGRGLLTVAVQKNDTAATSLAASVVASAITLSGHRIDIPMREVREGDSISYLGQFPVRSRDTLRFSLAVTPAGASTPLALSFSKDYVGD